MPLPSTVFKAVCSSPCTSPNPVTIETAKQLVHWTSARRELARAYRTRRAFASWCTISMSKSSACGKCLDPKLQRKPLALARRSVHSAGPAQTRTASWHAGCRAYKRKLRRNYACCGFTCKAIPVTLAHPRKKQLWTSQWNSGTVGLRCAMQPLQQGLCNKQFLLSTMN